MGGERLDTRNPTSKALEHAVVLRPEQRCDFAADFSCLCR
jgi:hypothetical protein